MARPLAPQSPPVAASAAKDERRQAALNESALRAWASQHLALEPPVLELLALERSSSGLSALEPLVLGPLGPLALARSALEPLARERDEAEPDSEQARKLATRSGWAVAALG